jgi:hypothetical protein
MLKEILIECFFLDFEMLRNIFDKCWFICLLIIGMHVWTIHSYGDIELLTDDNDADTLKRVNFESLIESMDVNHIIKRLAAVIADTTSVFRFGVIF